MMKEIENVDLTFLSLDDYQELKKAMIESYTTMPENFWEELQIKKLISTFPEGQVVIKVNNQIAGCALSLIVDYHKFGDNHTYNQITGDNTFSTHTPDGDILYGIDIFIKPEFRGLRLGRRLYDYFVAQARLLLPSVQTGEFGADMQVHLVNDGPVTIPLRIAPEVVPAAPSR